MDTIKDKKKDNGMEDKKAGNASESLKPYTSAPKPAETPPEDQENTCMQHLVTPDIQRSVEDAQLLLAYLAHDASVDIDHETLETFVRSKYLLQNNQWSPEAEIDFHVKYDRMAKIIEPVTIESLRATMPLSLNSDPSLVKHGHSKAERAVFRYRVLATLALLLLLFAQIYWIVGSDLNKDMMSIYEQREEVTLDIEKLRRLKGNDKSITLENDIEMLRLQRKNDFLNQQLDSHYELLLGWNRVWQTVMLMGQFEEKVTRYVAFKHKERRKDIESNIQLLENKIKDGQSVGEFTNGDFATELESAKQDLKKETLRHELSRARNKMFLTQLSSAFVLGALQVYFLPLLYGLLGAATFVLRTLSTEIKTLTYSYGSEIRFRLRLSLGALAGMAVGWFLKPDTVSELASLSPMALAFLMGYNVEVLFSIMDKFIEVISKWTPDAQKSPATQEKAAK